VLLPIIRYSVLYHQTRGRVKNKGRKVVQKAHGALRRKDDELIRGNLPQMRSSTVTWGYGKGAKRQKNPHEGPQGLKSHRASLERKPKNRGRRGNSGGQGGAAEKGIGRLSGARIIYSMAGRRPKGGGKTGGVKRRWKKITERLPSPFSGRSTLGRHERCGRRINHKAKETISQPGHYDFSKKSGGVIWDREGDVKKRYSAKAMNWIIPKAY